MYRLLVGVLSYSAGFSLYSSHASVARHKRTGDLVGVALLLVDVCLALIGCVLCLGVGHAEQVVSIDAAVGATVAGNGSANHMSFVSFIHAEEIVHGLQVGLGSSLSVRYLGVAKEFCGVTLEFLVLNNTISILKVGAKE